jgi:hypothetical protein
MNEKKDSTTKIYQALKGNPPENPPVDKDNEEEIIKIINERFSGIAKDHSGPMQLIPKDSILNAPIMDDRGNCVVQEPSNTLNL